LRRIEVRFQLERIEADATVISEIADRLAALDADELLIRQHLARMREDRHRRHRERNGQSTIENSILLHFN
jgi:hypothetical protein